jgi:pyruvate/2-oxoglutarate dehydrogenase complex dihydrolipoamide acyltransferase (E2) component
VGTFSISTLGGQGVLNAHHPLITTSSLAIGPIDSSDRCEIVLICDHRAVDGWIGAQAIHRLQQVLQNEILDELVKMNSERKVA